MSNIGSIVALMTHLQGASIKLRTEQCDTCDKCDVTLGKTFTRILNGQSFHVTTVWQLKWQFKTKIFICLVLFCVFFNKLIKYLYKNIVKLQCLEH